MYEQTKKIFNCDYRVIVNRFDEDEKRFNKIWGSRFIFSIDKEITEKKVNEMIDDVVLLW